MTLPVERCPGSHLPTEGRETCPCCHTTPGVGQLGVFMYHERTDLYHGLPRIETNEDGDMAWAFGHISAHLFVRALVRSLRVDGCWNDLSGMLRELFAHGRHDVLREVEYVWLREDPANEEIYHLAAPWHPKAQAFTQLALPA